MWFSQFFLKTDRTVTVEVYTEDATGKGVFMGALRRDQKVPPHLWDSSVVRIFPADGRTLCAVVELKEEETEQDDQDKSII